MKFAAIAPTKYLNTFSIISKEAQMCLAHQAVKDEEYVKYFQERKEEGDWVLCDNGAHEGVSIKGRELVDLCLKMKPSCVIMPDVLDNYQQTIDNTMEFYTEHKKEVLDAGIDLMAVPQGHTYEEFVKAYQTFANMPDVNYIGISYTILFDDTPGFDDFLKRLKEANTLSSETKTNMQALRRSYLISHLVAKGIWNLNKKHHLLGLSTPAEFTLYMSMIADFMKHQVVEVDEKGEQKSILGNLGEMFNTSLHSCDTTLCFNMGIKNRTLDSGLGIVVGEREPSWEDFGWDGDLDSTQRASIIHNVKVCNTFAQELTDICEVIKQQAEAAKAFQSFEKNLSGVTEDLKEITDTKEKKDTTKKKK